MNEHTGNPTARALERLTQAAARLSRPATFMEVCGTHTMAAFRSGLHSLMPANVRLLSGPGCPVCVTPQSDIDALIALAGEPGVILCTYGDMMRVPGSRGSLERVRSDGGDVRVVYSATQAVDLARREPGRQVVFAAVGFETTAPATAAALQRAQAAELDNFSLLTSHKTIVPAMAALLSRGEVAVDGFLCPGHVSVIIGAGAYQPIVRRFAVPCVIGGFEPAHMAAALAHLVDLTARGEAKLINDYPEAVHRAGNPAARALLTHYFQPVDARWRGLGVIPGSGLELRPAYRSFDARHRFGVPDRPDCEPRGCRCGEVIAGVVDPPACGLFATACTPINPIGPCMVSGEGTCQAWFRYRRDHIARLRDRSRRPVTAEAKA